MANKFKTYFTYFVFILLLFSNKVYAQQVICFNDEIQHTYKVDETENDGEGTTNSTYTWIVEEGDFKGEIVSLTNSNNQIEINWKNTPIGNYTLKVTESNNTDCVDSKILTVTIQDCRCTIEDSVFAGLNDTEVCSEPELTKIENLSKQDDNGVAGTWKVTNTDNVYTYTFQPSDDCHTEFEFKMVVLDQIMAVFDKTIYKICDKDTFSLPNPNNGVVGHWDRNYVGFGEYTFIPDSDCGTPSQIEVKSLDTIQAEFDQQVYEICDENDFVLPNPNNGIVGHWDRNYAGFGQYTFIPDSDCGVSTSITVSQQDITIPSFDIKTEYCVSNEVIVLPIKSKEGIRGNWNIPMIDTQKTKDFDLIFEPKDEECYSNFEVLVQIINCYINSDKLEFSHVISPNNDGKNDVWKVDGIVAFPNAEISIFDRYGKLLYQGIGADQIQWDGTYLGRPVNSGDYWYVLKLTDEIVKTGSITVKNY